MEVIDIVKAKLSGPVPGDEILNMHIEEVGQAIKTYINSSLIPNDLNFVYANMVIDLISDEQRKADPEAQRTVTSVKEGDVQVQFGSAKVETRERATERLIYDYSSQLNKFRKLRW